MIRTLRLVAVSFVVTLCGIASAVDPWDINLGRTSFLDGVLTAEPGFYYQLCLDVYKPDTFNDLFGIDELDIPIRDTYLLTWIHQFIYQSDQPVIAGGRWGVDVSAPYRYGIADGQGSLGGFGDITAGLFLQFDPVVNEDGPVFVHRLALQGVFPTEESSSHNVYAFNPYWAFTWFAASGCEVSGRIHYLWQNSTKNRDFYYQPGQIVHLNLAASYELIEDHLRIGVNSYYLKQITDDKVEADDFFLEALLSAFVRGRTQMFGIGPGLLYSFSNDDHLFLNAYWETQNEKAFEGFRLMLRWVHHF